MQDSPPPHQGSEVTDIEVSETGEISPILLSILVCPVTGKSLEYDRAGGELISHAAGLAFPIRDGIPILLDSQARKVDQG